MDKRKGVEFVNTIEVLKRLCDAYFLTLSEWDRYGEWPRTFMEMIETTVYGGTPDTEETPAIVERAYDLFIGCVSDELKEGKE